MTTRMDEARANLETARQQVVRCEAEVRTDLARDVR
jgi:hypothetical protein